MKRKTLTLQERADRLWCWLSPPVRGQTDEQAVMLIESEIRAAVRAALSGEDIRLAIVVIGLVAFGLVRLGSKLWKQ